MKKSSIIILSLVIIIIFLIIIIFVINMYDKFILHNNVISYGPEMTLGEIIGAPGNYEEETDKLLSIKLKKAITKSLGSTAMKKHYIYNNEIIFVGNRNLVTINGETYIYLTELTESLPDSY